MTTKEAFGELIKQRGWYKAIGLTETTGSALARRFKAGEQLSTDKMEDVLEKAGYKVVQEKQWAPKETADNWNSELEKALKGQVFNVNGHLYQADINNIKAVER